MFGSLAVDGLQRFASYRHTCQEDTYVQSSTWCSTLVYAHTHTLSPFKVNKRLCQGIIKLTDVLEVCADAFTKRRKMGASKESERRTFQRSMSTMCRSALTSPLAPVRPWFGPTFSLNPKHSTAILVHRQIPLSAGLNLLVWWVDEGWREASGCSIWLLSGHSCLWDVTESAGTGQQNTKSMGRVHLGNPKSMQDVWRLQREYTRASFVFHLVWLLHCKRLSYIRFWKCLSTVLK